MLRESIEIFYELIKISYRALT